MSNFEGLFALAPTGQGDSFQLATVTALLEGAPLVQFDGETAASQKQYKRLASYTSPAVNDRVLLLRLSGTYIILGKIAS
jgi:hypothetical protein